MAEVIITVKDKDDDSNGFTVGFEFNPPVARGEVMTSAQRMGAQIADAFAGQGECLEGFEEGFEDELE